MDETIKTAKAIGRYIGMSVATFHRHKDADRVPYYYVGRTICAKQKDLDRWIEDQKDKVVAW